VDKGLKLRDLTFARIDTLLGSVFTQIIMAAVIVTTAATLFVRHIPVSDAAHAALALVGASMLGAFVVSLATAWAFGALPRSTPPASWSQQHSFSYRICR
jgi:Mn2+/Fe2+ NRAMP family transporter